MIPPVCPLAITSYYSEAGDVELVEKLGMLVPGSCSDEAGDSEAGEEVGNDEAADDAEAADAVTLEYKGF